MITEGLLLLAAWVVERLTSLLPVMPELQLSGGVHEWLSRANALLPVSEVVVLVGWLASVAVGAVSAWAVVFVAKLLRGG